MNIGRLRHLEYKWLVAIVFISGLFLDMVDMTVVNVAIPQLGRDFHAGTSHVEWTVTIYMLSLAVFIPAAGYLSDRFGTKRCFLLAMAIFIVASGLCGQARSLNELIAFRFLQGIGGGMMTPVGTAMLSREFPGAERAKASAIMSVPIVFAPMLGPIFGGYLVQYVSWRWIFYLNLPAGIAGFAFAYRVLKEHKEPYAREGFDLIGLITGSGGAAFVLFGLSRAATLGWTSTEVLACLLGGLALVTVFVFQELRTPVPIIDVRLFKRPLFAQGNLIMLPAFAMFSGFLFILTLYLQELQGWSPFQAGLITAPSSIMAAISLPLASKYYPRVGPKKMLIAGCVFSCATMVPFGFLTATTPLAVIVIMLCVRRLPFSFASVAAQTIIYGPLESSKQGAASSAYNTIRQVSASLGVALLATIQVNQGRTSAQHGYQMAFLAGAAFMIIPIVVALLVSNKEAEHSLELRTAKMSGGGVTSTANSPAAAPTGGGGR
jgi:EmrB/QacA subfamily drug resistance transporter